MAKNLTSDFGESGIETFFFFLAPFTGLLSPSNSCCLYFLSPPNNFIRQKAILNTLYILPFIHEKRRKKNAFFS